MLPAVCKASVYRATEKLKLMLKESESVMNSLWVGFSQGKKELTTKLSFLYLTLLEK